MKPEVEQELSHILLVELLAYQFASPVRWIETQDVILADEVAERIVEIGPSDTLGGMARRTLAAKYEAYDSALSLQRQILCYNKDLKEIYYDVDPALDEEEPQSESSSAQTPTDAPRTNSPVVSAVSAPPQQGPAANVPDLPVSAAEILQAVIAQKLKKPTSEISMQKAIKDLVGGKSTLQNEIIGDLGKEFGSLSEKPEDLPLDELAAAVQTTFDGQLGKHSHSLIARLMSSKMPGGFTVTTARKYLQDRWGLQSGRQDGVLLLSLTMEPEARLSKEQDAKSFWDRVAGAYGVKQGITYSSGDSGSSSAASSVSIDPALLESMSKGQSTLFRQQLEVLARYLQLDLKAGDRALTVSQTLSGQLQAQLDLWLAEHGEFYANGIQPIFSPLKCRVYDSNWNWARQDALMMYFDIIFGRLKLVDREIVAQCIRVMNRSNPVLMEFMQYRINNCPQQRGETYDLARDLGYRLIDNCREVLHSAPVFKDVSFPTAPQTTISAQGELSYAEVPRPAVRKLEQYVKEMAAGGRTNSSTSRSQAQHDLQKIYRLIRQQSRLSRSSQVQIKNLYSNILRNLTPDGEQSSFALSTKRGNIQRNRRPSKIRSETVPFLHLRRKEDHGWEYSKKLTSLYLEGLEVAAKDGLSFAGKHVLMTGAGAGSIGSDILQGLVSGGARVVVTTSRFSKEATDYYQGIYSRYGGKGSQLIVVPFNQGSKQDIKALVDYIYDPKTGLGWDLDTIVPFAAIPTNGREIDNIDSNCELGHRIMLTNLLRLLGAIKTQKFERGIETRPAQVILPLSPNHGTFGADGLYSEAKLGLETLFNRWGSESWGNYLTICGAVIGWTRGTGLMTGNNTIAQGIEAYGVRTFSQQEMAFNILGLMAPAVVNLCQVEPVFADLNGGLQNLPNYQEISSRLRQELKETAEIRRALYLENAIDNRVVNGQLPDKAVVEAKVQRRANLKFDFPRLPEFSEYAELHKELADMVDLERVVVVTGFAEVGPWGNSRTRWEMEAYGQFSLEGCIEMAWIMGLIKNHNGPIKGKMYSGWVDAKSGEPVEDKDIKSRYESHILAHSGIRLIEPELFDGYDPKKKQLLQEVVLEEDLPEFETSQEAAEEFKRYHGDHAEITEISETGQYAVQLRKGAVLLIPKALKFDRTVAGQIPTGWDARRYGIPEDIISQVDPVTLYVLVCVAESMLSAGVTDPYEFYKYVHVSQVGNCVGSGVGGMTALRGMYKDRWMDKPIQKDILQESFINTMSAWVNMLLLSSSGPIKTPVGACATAVESLDIGYETIVEGKARVCFVGGFDDFAEEGSYEFANMKATSNAEDEFAHGRNPRDMSRPTTSTRSGFMESQGCGVQILMDAKLALDMGVPIYGIVAMTATATDKIGRSVPAPGQGILTTAREAQTKFPSPLLDISYRRRQLQSRRGQIKQWLQAEMELLENDIQSTSARQNDVDREYIQMRIDHINKEASRQEKEAMNTWGNSFYRNDPEISPLRGALAVWGLTVDDIDVASFHGTSTKANDKNESDAIQKMLSHLNRSKGNALLGIFQKYLTGHPKGAAGAWMFNGVLQVLNSGLVPGNRNADNIDQELEMYNHILYPSRSIQTDGIKAASVTSFGFGQKGAQAIALHPKYLFATLDENVYNAYRSKVSERYKKAYRYAHNSLVNNNLFQAKDTAPYTKELESQVLLNPLARVTQVGGDRLQFNGEPSKRSKEAAHSEVLLDKMANDTTAGEVRVGVDVEDIQSINIDNRTFIERNFSDAERVYCEKSPSPQASFAGKWCAKEAVFKSLGTASRGGGASMIDIEILNDKNGAPYVKLSGNAQKAADESNVRSVKVSISHSDKQAMAVALSR